MQKDPPSGISAAPDDNNVLLWNAVIFGPPDTPFEDGAFYLTQGVCVPTADSCGTQQAPSSCY